MALTTCPECGGQISSLAPVCPHCGFNPAIAAEIAERQQRAANTRAYAEHRSRPSRTRLAVFVLAPLCFSLLVAMGWWGYSPPVRAKCSHMGGGFSCEVHNDGVLKTVEACLRVSGRCQNGEVIEARACVAAPPGKTPKFMKFSDHDWSACSFPPEGQPHFFERRLPDGSSPPRLYEWKLFVE